jgi:hypothetical protein
MEGESCPICWRVFSLETIPVCLPCGHSCCRECSLAIRSCSLCRYRLTSNYQPKTNFSLVSMVEKVHKRETIDKTSQSTQTESEVFPIQPVTSRSRQQKVSLLEGKSMTVQIKRSGIEFQFK